MTYGESEVELHKFNKILVRSVDESNNGWANPQAHYISLLKLLDYRLHLSGKKLM